MPAEEPRVLSLLSHELRGPLGVVRGYLRLLSQSAPELSDRSKEAIDAALRASDKLAEILDEASLLAHLQTGRVALELKDARLSDIVHAAVRSALLPADFGVNVAPLPSVRVSADEARLTAALATLLTVVARAQPGSRELSIESRTTKPAGHAVVQLVLSHPSPALARAVESDVNHGRGGYGLALPIALTVLSGHGGSVRELRDGDRLVGVVVTLPVV
jgi:signal transduction histidine kinase